MQTWVRLKAFNPTDGVYHVNLEYVTHMHREDNVTVLFIAGAIDNQAIHVEETPEQILALPESRNIPLS
jgi:hypothetical protein